MHQAQCEGRIRTGFNPNILVGFGCRDRVARIDNNQTGTTLLGIHDRTHQVQRLGFTGIGPPDDDHVGIRRTGPKLAVQKTKGKLAAEKYPTAAGQTCIAISPGAYPGRLREAGQTQVSTELGCSGSRSPEYPGNCRPSVFCCNLFELVSNEIECFVPGDTLKFSLPALADTFQGILQPVGVIGDIQTRKTSQAYAAMLWIGKFGRLHFHHPVTLHMGCYPTGIDTTVGGAHSSYQICINRHKNIPFNR